jgi:regulation of enolase protein 1 (concanavalin A-like superfamily)
MRVCIRSKNSDNERRVGVRRVVTQESIQVNSHNAKKKLQQNTILYWTTTPNLNVYVPYPGMVCCTCQGADRSLPFSPYTLRWGRGGA